MKIVCDRCGGTVAHIIGNSLVEVVRQGHKVQVVGKDYTVMLSCPNTGECSNKVAITVENGQVLLDNLKRKEAENGGAESNTGSKPGEATGKPEESKGGESQEAGGDESPENGGTGDGGGQEGGARGEPGESEEGQGNDSSGTGGEPPKSRKYTRI